MARSRQSNPDRSEAPSHHAQPAEVALATLHVDRPRGLDAVAAARRLARYGENRLPKPARRSLLAAFTGQLVSPLVLTLVAAAAIATAVGLSAKADASLLSRFGDAIAIVLIVVINAVLGVVQEARAEAALNALQKLTAPHARVRRGGAVILVPGEEVVPGDILELSEGDAVAADARLIESTRLAVEEAALTGESVPADKDANATVATTAPLAERRTMLYSGTVVVRGKAAAVVTATGADTELGHIGAVLGGIAQDPTPLERRLRDFGRAALTICLGLSALLLGWGVWRSTRPLPELLLEAVSLAVAAIPEGLPAITTITLALGMQRMARRGALVRRLLAVEALGTATVIASDKTGTLTENQMSVREAWTIASGRAAFRGNGYAPEGDVRDERGAPVGRDGPLHELFVSAVLCNDATLTHGRGSHDWEIRGDPTEVALLTAGGKLGVWRDEELAASRIVKELPFDGDRKRMTVVTIDGGGARTAHVKGSLDALLPRCITIREATGPRPLEERDRLRILAEVERMAASGMRVLAVCRREAPANLSDDDLEANLTLVGVVGITDPPRPAAAEAVASCKRAGIRVIMITGDHPATGMAIAREIGLWEPGDEVMGGDELAALSQEELSERVMRVRVFARTTADQKHRIVRALKARKQVVAMTGDGVNDAPALRESHIGVAMGKSGTDVARGAADLVLADDDFSTIVEAVAEGRAIYHNIQKFIFFLLSSNMGLVIAVFVISFIGRWPPLSPLMILWINLVTNGLPALALGVDPARDDLMHQPPRDDRERLMGGLDYLGVLYVGVVIGGSTIALYAIAEAIGTPLEHARTMAFTLLAIAPLFHAWSCRSPVRSLLSARPFFSPALFAAVIASAAIHLVALWIPALRPVFHSRAPSLREWALVLVLSAMVVPAVELAKLGRRLIRHFRRRQAKARGGGARPIEYLYEGGNIGHR